VCVCEMRERERERDKGALGECQQEHVVVPIRDDQPQVCVCELREREGQGGAGRVPAGARGGPHPRRPAAGVCV
jgi:hypothetical protein